MASDILTACLPGHAGLPLSPVHVDFAVLELFPDKAEVNRLDPRGSWRIEKELTALWDDCDDREESVAIEGVGVSFRITQGPVVTLGRDATLVIGYQNGVPVAALKDRLGEIRVDYRGDEWRYAESGPTTAGDRVGGLWIGHPRFLLAEVWVPPISAPGHRSRVSPLAERRAERLVGAC